jgi:hypothetical protein
MRLAQKLLRPIFERCSSIISPGHLEVTAMPLHTLDAQAGAEGALGLEILDHMLHRLEKGASLGLGQGAILAQE